MNEQTFKDRSYAVSLLLNSLPPDVLHEGTVETPKRVAKMWDELTAGYEMKPEEILSKTFDVPHGDGENTNGVVIIKDIGFYSCCEHHMVPFFGKVHIAYVPREKVVGLSKFARLVECFSRRLQVQERLTQQIVDSIQKELNPYGVMVIIEAEHMCMTMRGIKKPGTSTTTSRTLGVFYDKPEARNEALHLIYGN